MQTSVLNYSFPKISRNVSGNFWKPFPEIFSRKFSEKSSLKKKCKVFSLRNFCLKRMRVLTLQRTSRTWSGDQTTSTGTHSESFHLQICKWKLSECVPVEVVWSPDHVLDVRCSVRTLIRFKQKFLKLNTLHFFFKLDFSENFRENISGNGFQKFPETFLEIFGNE